MAHYIEGRSKERKGYQRRGPDKGEIPRKFQFGGEQQTSVLESGYLGNTGTSSKFGWARSKSNKGTCLFPKGSRKKDLGAQISRGDDLASVSLRCRRA